MKGHTVRFMVKVMWQNRRLATELMKVVVVGGNESFTVGNSL